MASRTVYNCTPTFSIRYVAPKVLIGREAKAPTARDDSINVRRFMRAFYTETAPKKRYSAGKTRLQSKRRSPCRGGFMPPLSPLSGRLSLLPPGSKMLKPSNRWRLPRPSCSLERLGYCQQQLLVVRPPNQLNIDRQ